MAVLTKSQVHQFNRKMLGLGAPVVIDGVGYNKFDFGKMADFAECNPEQLTDKQTWYIALTLGHYKNTQLTEYKSDIEETIAYYKPADKQSTSTSGSKSEARYLVRVVGTTRDYVDVAWRYNPEVSAALKGQLDKSQYCWKKVDSNWILSIKWGYVDEICAEFADLGLDVSQLYAAKPPMEQMVLEF